MSITATILTTLLEFKPATHVPAPVAPAGASAAGGLAAGLFGLVIGLVQLVLVVLIVASLWKVFTKAGEAGWMSIIPILNLVILLKIVRKPVWWIILFCIPLVNLVIGFLIAMELAKAFGQGVGFAVGLVFLPFIFYPMLAFGSAQYTPPGGAVAGGGFGPPGGGYGPPPGGGYGGQAPGGGPGGGYGQPQGGGFGQPPGGGYGPPQGGGGGYGR